MKKKEDNGWLIENIAISIPILLLIIVGVLSGKLFELINYPYILGLGVGVVIGGGIGCAVMNKLLIYADK